jgi:hypothetical protein
MNETGRPDVWRRQGPRSGTWVAGVGGFLGGFVSYVLLAGLGGGVDWEDRLTFDQSGELELEGLGIWLGIVVGVAVGVPLGTYIALRRANAPRAGATALLTAIATAAVTIATFGLLQSGPGDPLIAPYAVFGGWFLVPLLVRYVAERRLHRRHSSSPH